MGHIDHGKTSLLDRIRSTKVAEKESGGITQHIGAYQVEHQGKLITFIDTPGHEAFYAMRSRGAKVADIAVLVVAADDGVMPQTKEAIKHIKQAGMPMVVAINKMDKPNANPARVKNQLLEDEIVVEEFKGKVPVVEVSATTGQGIEGLLEIINLVAEVEELTMVTSGETNGAVIEAELNRQRGPTATLLVKEGILKVGDVISTSSTFGKVQNLEDFLGNPIKQAGPSTPALVVGLEEVPGVGERFVVNRDTEEARARVEGKQRKFGRGREVLDIKEGQKVLNIILKADVQGTLEAVRELIRGIQSENVVLRVLDESIGDIMESDIKLAATSKAFLVGFRVKVDTSAAGFARQTKVEVVRSDIIYELVEKVREKINELLSTERTVVDIGELKVLAIFRTEKARMIVGGKVTEGAMRKGARIRVARGEEILGEGRAVQLKIQDKAVGNVDKSQECGVLFEGSVRIQVGDVLQAYEIQDKKIEL